MDKCDFIKNYIILWNKKCVTRRRHGNLSFSNILFLLPALDDNLQKSTIFKREQSGTCASMICFCDCPSYPTFLNEYIKTRLENLSVYKAQQCQKVIRL